MAGGRPIDVVINTDVDGVVTGAEKVADSFDKIQDSLKDTAKAGEDSFKDVTKASDKAGDAIEDDFKDAAKVVDRDLTKALESVEDQAKTTGKTVGREVTDGTDKAGEGFDNLKEESASTAKEAAASFGSIEDAADAMQEVVANAFVGFGPAGMAAGLVAAAGIGLVISALQDNADKVNENKEKVIGMAQAIKDNGGVLRQSDYIQAMEDYGYSIVDTKEWLDIFQEDAITGFEKMSQLSKDSGIDLKTAFDGSFGSVKDAEEGLAKVNDKLTALKEKKEAVYNTTGSIMEPVDTATLTSLEDLKTKMEDNIKNQRIAEEMEKLRRAAIEGTVEATLEDIAALEKKNSILQDGVSAELDYLDQAAATKAAFEAGTVTLDKNTESGRDNIRMLLDTSDAAITMADDQLKAGQPADTVAASYDAQREALLKQMDTMTGSRAKSEELAKAYGLFPKEISTEIKTNGAAKAKTDIETIPATKDTTVNVDDGGTTGAVQGRVNAITGRDNVLVDVDDNLTVAAVQGRINAITGRDNVFVDVDDNYTVKAVQQRIDGIKGRDMVKVDVDDDYTVREVQKRIDGIKGRNVDVNVNLANLGSVEETLRRLTLPRTAYVDIVERPGKRVV
ncbi:hypothetical protein B1A87_005230 [Arthrobacter sp. KBS0703]|uniref:hypothetical protein n=1 Tax=Arthrobacter sp. KBS0703 TaxID=1955698 RepID=UPI00098FE770|nr:hypothetical protein [Arthrobacter sp. KBS0703]TSE15399.1 hypothetical protein B1A87_005230 [Arthrobacter sp. KBS0703]